MLPTYPLTPSILFLKKFAGHLNLVFIPLDVYFFYYLLKTPLVYKFVILVFWRVI